MQRDCSHSHFPSFGVFPFPTLFLTCEALRAFWVKNTAPNIQINSHSNRAIADEHRKAESLTFSLTHFLPRSLCQALSLVTLRAFFPSTSCSRAQGFAILKISMQLPYTLLIRLYEDMELLCFYPQPPPTPSSFTDTFTCKSASDLSLLPGL